VEAMTSKAANSQTPTTTTAATTEYQELLPNELATIHGGWSLDFLMAPSSNTGTTQTGKDISFIKKTDQATP
jgi:hypothetical protein